MDRPHVFQRSAPRARRKPFSEPANAEVTARLIAAQLGAMIDKATGAGLTRLANDLEVARVAAERVAVG